MNPREDDTTPHDRPPILDDPEQVGKYFRVHEFDCHSGEPYPTSWINTRLVRLVGGVLDPLRETWGAPLLVVSGFRTLVYNAAIRGAPRSQHIEGKAADIRPVPVTGEPYELTVQALHRLVATMWDAAQLVELGGLGYYPGRWLHLDVRDREPVGHLATWVGKGIGSEQ